MPRPSQKDKILQAAVECFAELGYDATRVRHVAERAGVSEAALYRHYPSMQALATELYGKHFTAFAARLDEATAAGPDAPSGPAGPAGSAGPPDSVDPAGSVDPAAPASPAGERLRRAVRATLATYRAEPAAFTFALLRTPAFMPGLPPGTRYPIEIIEQVIADGQDQGELRAGQHNLLGAIFFGCVLRPIILASLAAPGALDLLGDTQHDQVIEDAAVAALRAEQENTP